MNDIVFVVLIVVLASFIGGMTNHLAIKMLFHPRNKVYFAGRRIPFTPGLIPKRKTEIARSLGEVVANYLVTTHGLSEMIKKPVFRNKIEQKINETVIDWANNDTNFDQLANHFWTDEQWIEVKNKVAMWFKEAAVSGITWLWDEKKWKERTLISLVPEDFQLRKNELAEKGADLLIDAIKGELTSLQGERLLKKISSQLMDQAGGVLGTLAGLFMDEDKMNSKIKSAVITQLDSPTVRDAIIGFVEKKIDQIGGYPLEEVVHQLTGQKDIEIFISFMETHAFWQKGVDKLALLSPKDILGQQQAWLSASIPVITDKILYVMDVNMDRIVTSIDLPQLVEEQVQQFPIERLEEIILSVSGKEFRAITWLGAVLGGMIGLLQAAFTIWFR